MNFIQDLVVRFSFIILTLLISTSLMGQEYQGSSQGFNNPVSGNIMTEMGTLVPEMEFCLDDLNLNCLYRFAIVKNDEIISDNAQNAMDLSSEITNWSKSQCIIPENEFPGFNWTVDNKNVVLIGQSTCNGKTNYKSVRIEEKEEIDPFPIPRIEKKRNSTPYYFRNQIQFSVENTGSYDHISCRQIQPKQSKSIDLNLDRGFNHLVFRLRDLQIKKSTDNVVIEIRNSNSEIYTIRYQKK